MDDSIDGLETMLQKKYRKYGGGTGENIIQTKGNEQFSIALYSKHGRLCPPRLQ
jgi:hypothetical protein